MSDEATRPTGMTLLLSIAALGLLYFVSGWLGLRLAFEHKAATLIWPPSGLSLAALILFGHRLWPGVFFGSVAISVMQGFSPQVSAGIAIGSTLEALAGSILLSRVVPFRPSLDRLQDVAALMIVGGAFAAVVAASVGVTVLWLDAQLDSSSYFRILLTWWQGDLGGVVVLAPVLLLLRSGRPAWSVLLAHREFWAIVILLFAMCFVMFSDLTSGEIKSISSQLPLFAIVWAAARLGSRGAAVVAVPTLLFAIFATARGQGPFATGNTATDMSLLWLYVATIGGMAPTLAAAISQRDAADARRRLDVSERLQIEREHLLLEQRELIMREMHDGVGGQLVSVLSMVQRGQASPAEIADGLRHALDDMRIMIDSLATSRAGLPVLLGQLRTRFEPLLRRNGLELTWRVGEGVSLDAFDPQRSLHFLRIIQEAVTNVIQHARASRVQIAISRGEGDGSTVTVEISDDGIGAVPEAAHRGRGMQNMIDRAGEIGGVIHFESASPGWRVRLLVPALPKID